MKTNNIIIGVVVVIILILIVGIGLFMISNSHDANSVLTNNTTDNITNSINNVVNGTAKSSDDSSQNQSQSSSSSKQYDDWQKDYETGKYDEQGNPIYRSVFSTSGGQNQPGIYESYWSANGPINEERIG